MGGWIGSSYRFGAAPLPTLSYRTSSVNGTVGPSSSFSWNSQDIGTAGANRTVIVFIGLTASSATPGAQVTGVTIGGVTATASSNSGAGGNSASIWTAAVPTGTTATIAVTASANVVAAMASVWAAYDLSSATPTDTATATGTATTHTLSLDLAADGLAVGGRISSSSAARTYTWSGATERADQTINISAYGTAADYSASAAEAPHALSVTASGSLLFSASAAASFR